MWKSGGWQSFAQLLPRLLSIAIACISSSDYLIPSVFIDGHIKNIWILIWILSVMFFSVLISGSQIRIFEGIESPINFPLPEWRCSLIIKSIHITHPVPVKSSQSSIVLPSDTAIIQSNQNLKMLTLVQKVIAILLCLSGLTAIMTYTLADAKYFWIYWVSVYRNLSWEIIWRTPDYNYHDVAQIESFLPSLLNILLRLDIDNGLSDFQLWNWLHMCARPDRWKLWSRSSRVNCQVEIHIQLSGLFPRRIYPVVILISCWRLLWWCCNQSHWNRISYLCFCNLWLLVNVTLPSTITLQIVISKYP